MLAKAVAEFLGVIGAVGAYLVVFTVAWTAALGAARLVAATRPTETRRTGALLRSAPGRCLLSGIAHLIVAMIVSKILGAINGLLGLLFGLWWLRTCFRGAVAWWMLRGEELHSWRYGTAGTEAEGLDEGVRAVAMASALPVFGWFFLFYVSLQGLGAETLSMMGRKADPMVEDDLPRSDDVLDEDAEPEDEATDFDVEESEG